MGLIKHLQMHISIMSFLKPLKSMEHINSYIIYIFIYLIANKFYNKN